MIGKRKRLLSYIKDKDVQKYQELVKKIGIRGWSQLMKKKQSKKKIQNKKKKNNSETTAFANLEILLESIATWTSTEPVSVGCTWWVSISFCFSAVSNDIKFNFLI